jgi:diguanylate cyclase (GGDEF)-like protein
MLSLVLMDVDHFKLVNDTYGHQQGDLVLAAIAETVQAELRSYDIAARYGGEEFALVLPETSLDEGIAVAHRLRQTVQEIAFPPPIDYLAITISQGIAALPAPHLDSVDALIRAADAALYRAKQNGRNRVEVMTNSPGE